MISTGVNDVAWCAVGATVSGVLATWFSQRRNRVLNIMPKIGFYRDLPGSAWYLQNFGKGAAQEVIFAELDSNDHLKHCIRLNPVLDGEKVYFPADEFKHCATLVAKYADINNRRYYSVCRDSETRYFPRDPKPELKAAKPLPEAQYPSIRRVYKG